MHKKLALAMVVLLLFGCRAGPLGRELASRAKDWQGWDTKKKEKAVPVVFDTAPFDVKRASLPPCYNGHDITKVYESFESGSSAQENGESRAMQRPVAPSADGRGEGTGARAFRESIAPGPPGNQLWYDADRGAFKVRIRVEPFFDPEGNVEKDRVAFVLAGYHDRTERPVAWDRQDSRTRWLLWEVSVADGPGLREKMETDRAGTFITAAGRVPPGDAPLSEENISALLVCVPRTAGEGLSLGPGMSPTMAGSGFRHYYLGSDLLELWVYDYRTGQVFVKETLARQGQR
jgi:hypothetical protein